MGNNHRGFEPDMSIHVREIGSKPQQNGVVPKGKYKELVNVNKITRDMDYNMQIMQLGEGAKNADVGVLRTIFKAYMELCREYSVIPNNMGAYTALGITIQTARKWAAGKAGEEKREFICWINQLCGNSTQTAMLTGTMSPTVAMWLQKNFDGLSDQPTPQPQDTDRFGAAPSVDDIIDRYSDLPDEEWP